MWQHLRFFNALFTSICLALIFNPISSSPVQLYTPSTHQSARRAVNQSKLPIFTRTLFEFEQKFFLSNNGNSSKTGSQDSGKNATTNPATSKAKRHSDLLRRDGEIYTVPLIPTTTDGQPTRYLGEMSIEGPNTDSQVRPIRFKTRFDTAAVNIYVQGIQCTEELGCVGPESAKYDEGGPVVGELQDIDYVGPREPPVFTGKFYEENVQLADIALRDKTEIFSVSEVEPPFGGIPQMPFDGNTQAIMGMGIKGLFGRIRVLTVPYFESLAAQQKFVTPEFSLFIGRGDMESSSQLVLGGRKPELFTGPIHSLSVTWTTATQAFWEAPITGVVVNGNVMASPLSSGLAYFASADNLISLPVSAMTALIRSIPGAFKYGVNFDYPTTMSHIESLYLFCDSRFDIAFRFPGLPDLDINVADLIYGPVPEDQAELPFIADMMATAKAIGKELCQSLVVTTTMGLAPEAPPLYVLGIPFLKSWYSIYGWRNLNAGGLHGLPYVSLARATTQAPPDGSRVGQSSRLVETS